MSIALAWFQDHDVKDGDAERRLWPLRERIEALFEACVPYRGEGLRNHCLRLYGLAQALLAQRGLRVDDDLLYALALVHDLGLVSEDVPGDDYLQRTLALFLREGEALELSGAEHELAVQCLLYNHRLKAPAGLGPEAACFRHAVWIEHSRGLLTFGLPRAEVRAIFAQHLRADFDSVLADFARRVLGNEPRSLWRGIFLDS